MVSEAALDVHGPRTEFKGRGDDSYDLHLNCQCKVEHIPGFNENEFRLAP